jgi:hypothetical protein
MLRKAHFRAQAALLLVLMTSSKGQAWGGWNVDFQENIMLRKAHFRAQAALLLVLMTSSKGQAWGGWNVDFTHVGYGGVPQYGGTS